MRQIDIILMSMFETLEALEHRLPMELDLEGCHTMQSLETKARIDALRMAIVEETKASVMSRKHKRISKIRPLKAA